MIFYLSAAVRIDGMVCESNLVSFPCSIHYILIIQVKQEGTHVLIINLNRNTFTYHIPKQEHMYLSYT